MWRFINELSREQTFIHLQGELVAYEDEVSYVAELLKQIADHRRVQVLAFHGDTLVGNTEITLDFAETRVTISSVDRTTKTQVNGGACSVHVGDFKSSICTLPPLRETASYHF